MSDFKTVLNIRTKKAFGEKFKLARKATGYSRAKLGTEISVSAKTIQSWEVGRTFPENLGMFPIIRDKLGFNIAKVLGETLNEEEKKLKDLMEKAVKEEKKVIRRAASVETQTE